MYTIDNLLLTVFKSFLIMFYLDMFYLKQLKKLKLLICKYNEINIMGLNSFGDNGLHLFFYYHKLRKKFNRAHCNWLSDYVHPKWKINIKINFIKNQKKLLSS